MHDRAEHALPAAGEQGADPHRSDEIARARPRELVAVDIVQPYRLVRRGQAHRRTEQIARQHRPWRLVGAGRGGLGDAAGPSLVRCAQRVPAEPRDREEQLLPPLAEAQRGVGRQAALANRAVRRRERGADPLMVVITNPDADDAPGGDRRHG